MASIGMVYLRPVQVVYFRVTGPYATSSEKAWGEMFGWLDRHGLRQQTGRGYGLQRDNPRQVGHDACRYDACVEVPDSIDVSTLESVLMQKLPGGAYARQRHVGSYDEVRHVIVGLRDHWMSSNNLVVDARRPLVTIYLSNPDITDKLQLKADVCLPVTAMDRTARMAV